jgi:hypothetical protein
MFHRRLHTVHKQLQNAIDHWMTQTLMENQLHVNRERIGDIIRKYLENCKICAKFALNNLTDEQKKHTSSRFLEMSLEGFKTILKQNVRAGRGGKNNRREP